MDPFHTPFHRKRTKIQNPSSASTNLSPVSSSPNAPSSHFTKFAGRLSGYSSNSSSTSMKRQREEEEDPCSASTNLSSSPNVDSSHYTKFATRLSGYSWNSSSASSKRQREEEEEPSSASTNLSSHFSKFAGRSPGYSWNSYSTSMKRQREEKEEDENESNSCKRKKSVFDRLGQCQIPDPTAEEINNLHLGGNRILSIDRFSIYEGDDYEMNRRGVMRLQPAGVSKRMSDPFLRLLDSFTPLLTDRNKWVSRIECKTFVCELASTPEFLYLRKLLGRTPGISNSLQTRQDFENYVTAVLFGFHHCVQKCLFRHFCIGDLDRNNDVDGLHCHQQIMREVQANHLQMSNVVYNQRFKILETDLHLPNQPIAHKASRTCLVGYSPTVEIAFLVLLAAKGIIGRNTVASDIIFVKKENRDKIGRLQSLTLYPTL